MKKTNPNEEKVNVTKLPINSVKSLKQPTNSTTIPDSSSSELDRSQKALISKTIDTQGKQTTNSNVNLEKSLSIKSTDTDQATQLRSTLAIGQLLASNRPTAGSRLIANELANLSRTIQEESVSLRKDLNTLSTTLKNAFEEERELRNMAANINRRPTPIFRRFPVFRRSRRLQPPPTQNRGRGMSLINASTNTPLISPNDRSPMELARNRNFSMDISDEPARKLASASSGFKTPAKSTTTTATATAIKDSTTTIKSGNSALKSSKSSSSLFSQPGSVIKNWLNQARGQRDDNFPDADGDSDSDSDVTPSVSPL